MEKEYTVEQLKELRLVDLRKIAKDLNIKSITAYRKDELVEKIRRAFYKLKKDEELEKEELNQQYQNDNNDYEENKYSYKDEYDEEYSQDYKEDSEDDYYYEEDEDKDDTFDLGKKFDTSGLLILHPDGFGFLKTKLYYNSNDDIYVSPTQIRRFKLKTGDFIEGIARVKRDKDKFSPLIFVKTVNGISPIDSYNRDNFEDLTPIFPDRKIKLEISKEDYAQRIVDLVSPIGRGQRGLIVSPPKAGKTTLLKAIEKSIERNNPDIKVIVLLIDERPEEVTDIKRFVNQYRDENDEFLKTEVVASTFDEVPQNHIDTSELVIERAKRLVEAGGNVVILLDSITRLSRAYNIMTPQSGRTLSGGLDPMALVGPKKFFGAARNIENGGSLTIIATTLVDTGSRMDDMIFEEFKGTGNMELHLDRSLAEKRIYPAVNIFKSGTRRDDLLQDEEEIECMFKLRNMQNDEDNTTIKEFIKWIKRTNSNDQFKKLINKQFES
ncbi:MAG: transcription termination factor Rho [Tissierellia bacterium]|nr:transcription termination factor Rho [Tissierellia bacterium]